jgi:5-carboxymethyl-2-hydroxymuconate isomerase
MSKLSTTVAADPIVDLAVIREMAHEFQNYILGDEVYRTLTIRVGRGDEQIQSSGGDLLARLHKLEAQRNKLTADHQQEFSELRRQIEELMSDFHTRFHALLERETKARLNSLKWFLDECQENRRQCRVQYPFEIRNRQRIAEIWKVLGQNPPQGMRGQIDAIDRRLRGLTISADFVWDEQVRSIYPREEYWYLYALPSM